MRKLVHTFFVLFFVISLFPTYFANAEERTIEINYLGIKLIVNGIEFIPTNVNNVRVDPFIYNGSIYLPVRAVCAALGKSVNWDGNTKTVTIKDAETTQAEEVTSPSSKSSNVPDGEQKVTVSNVDIPDDDNDDVQDTDVAISTIDTTAPDIKVYKESDLTKTSEVNEQITLLTGSHNVNASFDKIAIVINGSTIDPKDANGNPVSPFIYDGSVYLPVRAIGEAFGLNVNWVQNTSTVYIGK